MSYNDFVEVLTPTARPQVARLRVSRNKKTGKSKHYAFVEFMVPEVPRVRVLY